MFARYLLSALTLLLLSPLALAQDWGGFSLDALSAPADAEPQLATFAMAASVETYAKEKPFYVAYSAEIKNPWHAYYRNPATVGLPMEVSLKAPEGFEVSGPYWSMPKREQGAASVSYSYSAPLFVWTVTPTQSAPAEATFTVNSMMQACCDEGCANPTDHSLNLSLKEGSGAANPAWTGQEQKVEQLGDAQLEATATQTPTEVQLTFVTGGDVDKAYFFSDDNSIDPTAEQKLVKSGQGYVLSLPRNDNSNGMYPVRDAEQVGKPLVELKGVLSWGDGQFATVAIPFSAAAPAAAAGGIPEGILAIIGGLFLGGLILNLMPCVFPVIGLKIMSFVEMGGGSRRKIFMHSLAFVLGVLFSFWVLSLALIIVAKISVLSVMPWTEWFFAVWNDAGSQAISWASWLQNSWVVYGLLMVFLVLGMSMYGVFEIGVGATGAGQNLQTKKGYSGSFFSGLLATVVATPCSAPFLGPALASALSLPAPWLMLSMTFMGLGLSFPYLLMGCFPKLVQYLPRPGAWMESLKQGLSFLLFGAVAWLLFVYIAFVSDVMWMLIGLVVIAAAFWVYGRWCPLYKAMRTRIIGGAIALALLALGVFWSMPKSEPEGKLEWQAWSPAAMQAALDLGKPVFVDYTAAWCNTCQVNKKTAYTDDVYELAKQKGIVLMKADKTKPNADIDAELRRLGRNAVPVNALYIKGEAPAITDTILTPAYLKDFFTEKLTPTADEPEDDEEEQDVDEEDDDDDELEEEAETVTGPATY